MRTFLLRAALLAASMTSVTAYAVFEDPLDLPAVRSQIAVNRLLNGVVLAGKRLVAVGQRGHILFSDDSGKQWTQAAVPVSADLVAVHFPVAQMGWAVGHDGVLLATVDAGATWVKQLDGRQIGPLLVEYFEKSHNAERLAEAKLFAEQGPDKPFLDVFFENESQGFVIGPFNLILHTVDGGRSWTPWLDRIDNPKRLHLNAIRSIGGEIYIVGEQGLILKLDRKARYFKSLPSPYNGSFFGVIGNARVVVAYGLRGNAFASRDGGSSWQKIETGLTVGLMGGAMLRDGRIALVSQSGHLVVSTDGGLSFRPSVRKQRSPASSVVEIERGLIVVGARGVQSEALN